MEKTEDHEKNRRIRGKRSNSGLEWDLSDHGRRSPVPIHFLNRHLPRENGKEDEEGRTETAKGSTASTKNFAPNWWPNDDLVYPGIPFQVARYLCESSPGILDRMEAALHDSGAKTAPTIRCSVPVQSSLHHVAMSTNVLAMKESVIDGRTIAVSSTPDVVAQVTNDVKRSAGLLEVTKPDSASIASPVSRKSSECSSDRELYRFPKERITTTVERRSWLTTGGKEVPTNESDRRSERGSVGSCHSISSYDRGPTGLENHLKLSSERRSVTSEVESVFSERYELDSNYSERLESQSNMSTVSEVSGLEEEMFRIKKLLLETPSPSDDVPRDRYGTASNSYGSHLDVLREKAALEGQLEALRIEVDKENEERTQLQAQLAATKAELNTKKALARTSKHDLENLQRMLGDVSRKLHDSDDLVVGLREALEVKAAEVTQCRSEVQEAESEAQHLRIAMQEMKVEAESREGAVKGLKNKVVELHVAVQSESQARSRAESDLQTVRNEVASESKMKEWYKKQVQELQSTKSQAQQEVVSLMAEKVDSTTTMERLRFEGDQLRRQLAEMQQRAVREKEGLLRHLEVIEADVREREATYQQLQQDRGAVDMVVIQRMKKVEADRARLAEEAFSRTQLEHQLDIVRSELESRNETQAKLENEFVQLMKQLTIFQKTLSEKELDVQAANERYSQLEGKNQELQASLCSRDEQLAELRRDKAAAEIGLASAAREKNEMDTALVDVRSNVMKLDGRLCQMRDELIQKSRMVEMLLQEKTALEENVRSKGLSGEQGKKRESRLGEEVDVLREQLKQAQMQTAKLQEELDGGHDELDKKQETLGRVSGDLDRLVAENAILREKIHVLENFNVSGKTCSDLSMKLSNELAEVKNLLATKESRISELKRANEIYELQMRNAEVAEEQRNGDITSKEEAETHVHLLQEKLVEKEEAINRLLSTVKATESRVESLEDENGQLKEHVSWSRTESACQTYFDEEFPFLRRNNVESCGAVEFGTQTENWPEGVASYRQRLTQTEELLSEVQNRNKAQHRRYESNIALLTRKLKEALKTKKKLEIDLKGTVEKLSEATRATVVAVETKETASSEPTTNSRSKEAKMSYFQKRVTMLEKKLEEVQRLYGEERQRADHNEALLIGVEKEKGRLHVLVESNSALKQQALHLEAALSEQENTVQELDVVAKDSTERKQQEEILRLQQVHQLEEKLQQEQSTNKDLRKQIFKEKCDSKGLRKTVSNTKSSLEETTKLLEASRFQIKNLEREIEQQREIVYHHREEHSNARNQLSLGKTELETLRKEVDECRAKDPLIADQLNTLGWHLHQKNQEIACLRDREQGAEERRRLELEAAEKSVSVARKELELVKIELQASMKEKFSYQAKMTEMRAALKASVERKKIRSLESDLGARTLADQNGGGGASPLDLKLPESPTPYDDSVIASLLEQSLCLPESRPLSNLQVCLNTLKQEMAILQRQLLDHGDGNMK